MPMPRFKRTRKVVKYFIDVPTWINWQEIKSNTSYLKGLVKNTFSFGKKNVRKENFTDAMARYSLDEITLKERYQQLKILFTITMFLSAILFPYTVYVFLFGRWLNGAVCAALTMLGFTLAFRYHFWMYQITERRLGCTFKDWLAYIFKNESQHVQK